MISIDYDSDGHVWALRTKTTDAPEVAKILWSSLRSIAIRNEWTVVCDENLGFGFRDKNGEQYHIGRTFPGRRDIGNARAAFETRAAQKRQQARNNHIDELIATRGWEVLVNVTDSVQAGNCSIGTQNFRAYVADAFGLDTDTLPADALLAIRDDAFTRRAARRQLP